MLQGIPVILQTDSDSFAGTVELSAILGGDGDDGDGGEDGGENRDSQPEGMEELGAGVAAHILVGIGDTGSNNTQNGEQQGVVHTVEGGEHGTLLGIVGQAGLSRLGDHTLEGVADVVNSAADDEEPKAECGVVRQLVGDMEHDKAHDAQNDIADDHEGAVLTKLAVGLVHHEAHEGIGNAVPDTHNHCETGGGDHADAYEAHQVEGNVVHQEQVQVGSGVVQREAGHTPQRNAVNTVFAKILGINWLAHKVFSPYFFSPGLKRVSMLRTDEKDARHECARETEVLPLYYKRFTVFLLVDETLIL